MHRGERLRVGGQRPVYRCVVRSAGGWALIGLVITLAILKITWDSWQTIRASEPGEPLPDQTY
jgi:hypothetical protein